MPSAWRRSLAPTSTLCWTTRSGLTPSPTAASVSWAGAVQCSQRTAVQACLPACRVAVIAAQPHASRAAGPVKQSASARPLLPLPPPTTLASPPAPVAGIAYRARTGCVNAECVYQGNQVVGNAINGCAASGATAGMGFYSARPIPAWDSNQVRACAWPLRCGAVRCGCHAAQRSPHCQLVLRCTHSGAAGLQCLLPALPLAPLCSPATLPAVPDWQHHPLPVQHCLLYGPC